jgi:hypothetical protein
MISNFYIAENIACSLFKERLLYFHVIICFQTLYALKTYSHLQAFQVSTITMFFLLWGNTFHFSGWLPA